MKKSIFPHLVLTFIALLVLGVSCKKLAQLLSFTVSDSTSFTVPASGTLAGAVLNLPGVGVKTTAQSTYQNNNTSAQYVQDVTLSSLTLTTTNPTSQNFDFLQSISIYISTDAAGSDKVLLASLSPVPKGQTSIALNPAGNQLDKYLKASSYTLTTQAQIAQPLRQDTDIRADEKFTVHANIP